jgi:hypothetical protein
MGMVVQQIAKRLDVPVNELVRESVGLYLKQKLREIDVKRFVLGKKYGVSNVHELDELIQTGKVHEEGSFEDFFEFDHLEADRDKIVGLVKEL